MDLLCTEGLVASGVVDVVWGYGWRPPTLASLQAAQHGSDQSPSSIALPKQAVVTCFNMQVQQVVNQLGSESPDGSYIVISRDGDPSFKANLPSCVKHVFAINVINASERVTPMPTMMYFSADHGHIEHAATIRRTSVERALLAYSLDMPGSVYNSGHERITAIEYFRSQPWATIDDKLLGWATRPSHIVPTMSYPEYLIALREHDYCVTPRGYGVDRMAYWEAIALGTIPIAFKHAELMHFADMPIAFINHWEDVTAAWCDANLDIINRPTEKLNLSYWVERVREKRKELF